MKKLVNVTEVEGEGLEALMGERVTLFCMNYIYTGKLVGVNTSCVLLEDAGIVYETGELTSKSWKDMQKLPNDWYVSISSIESFGILK
jgi:hypothetical protein